jgi:hypothetical protein
MIALRICFVKEWKNTMPDTSIHLKQEQKASVFVSFIKRINRKTNIFFICVLLAGLRLGGGALV